MIGTISGGYRDGPMNSKRSGFSGFSVASIPPGSHQAERGTHRAAVFPGSRTLAGVTQPKEAARHATVPYSI
jgi:hypothetical protein